MHLTLVSQRTENGHSGNVVAEVPGRDPKAPILLVGGHLDSWDQGTGAIDDGVGGGDHHRGGEAHHGRRPAAEDHPRRLVRRRGAGRVRRQGAGPSPRQRPLRHRGRERLRRRPSLALQLAADENRSGGLRAARCRARAARDHQERQGGSGRHRRRTDDQRRRAVDLAQPGRNPLFRLSPHAGRHARQDRSGAAPPERRRVDGGAGHPFGRNRAGAETAASGVDPSKQGGHPMRMLFAIPLLLLAGCNVSKDEAMP